MVKFARPVSKVAIPLAVGSFLMVSGCKEKEKITPPKYTTDILVGDWQVAEVDSYDFLANGYNVIFSFVEAGDIKYCYNYKYNNKDYEYCYNAKWKWKDATQETLILDNFEDEADMKIKFDIDVLNDTNLEGTWYNYQDKETSDIKFLKVK